MSKVILYEPSYDATHREVLNAFAQGIPDAEVRTLGKYEPCDVAVIFGLVKKTFRPTWAKQEILDRHEGRDLIVVESASVLRGQYWAIGYGGIGGGADFRNADMPRARWESLGVKTRPWQSRPDGPIVIMGQLARDTNVQDSDHYQWCREAVAFYRSYGRVLFRPHPRSKANEIAEYGIDPALHDRRPLEETLAEARLVVTYNSTSGVDAALAGVPVVACHRWAFAWPVAAQMQKAWPHGRFPTPGQARFSSRRNWLASLAYTQWTLDEMRSGEPWRHLTRP